LYVIDDNHIHIQIKFTANIVKFDEIITEFIILLQINAEPTGLT